MNPDLKMDKWKRRVPALLLGVIVAAASSGFALAQQPAKDLSKLPARPARAWVRDGVIYQIFPRAFSAEGNFNGITAQLDRLKELGVSEVFTPGARMQEIIDFIRKHSHTTSQPA